MLTSNCNWQKM